MPDTVIAGVILAGGRSSRMGGAVKAHQPLAGKPLIQHVIDRIEPQVCRLSLSVERVSETFARYGLAQLADPQPGHNGPLGGLLSALSALEADGEWLLLAPCDAPFVPSDLAQRLHQRAADRDAEACVIQYRSELQPTFSIWNRSLLPSLSTAVRDKGMRGFKQYLDWNPAAVLDWEPSDAAPFFNINSPDALVRANELISESMKGFLIE